MSVGDWHTVCGYPFLSLCISFLFFLNLFSFVIPSPCSRTLLYLPNFTNTLSQASSYPPHILRSYYHQYQSFSPPVLTPFPSLSPTHSLPPYHFFLTLSPSLSLPLLHTIPPAQAPSQLTDHFESESSGYLGLRGHLTLVHP